MEILLAWSEASLRKVRGRCERHEALSCCERGRRVVACGCVCMSKRKIPKANDCRSLQKEDDVVYLLSKALLSDCALGGLLSWSPLFSSSSTSPASFGNLPKDCVYAFCV